MLDPGSNRELPPIPAKRYFTIGEVSELCDVKPHVLRYWETEFPSLSPVKRRGNRRYYQRHDVLMIRQIRALLYEQGYTIGGARLRLEGEQGKQETTHDRPGHPPGAHGARGSPAAAAPLSPVETASNKDATHAGIPAILCDPAGPSAGVMSAKLGA
jgi:DNA-binding transcriptional MerR regulator